MTNPLIHVLQNERIPSPHATHLSVPGKLAQSHRVTNSTGYNSTVFAGKDAQLDSVMDEIDRQGFIPEALIENETKVCIHTGSPDTLIKLTFSSSGSTIIWESMTRTLLLSQLKISSATFIPSTPQKSLPTLVMTRN